MHSKVCSIPYASRDQAFLILSFILSNSAYEVICNCDTKEPEAIDVGVLTSKDQLPVIGLHYGDDNYSYQWKKYNLGNLVCKGKGKEKDVLVLSTNGGEKTPMIITTTTSTTETTTTAPMTEKDVLVLSTRGGEKQPMIISFDGEYYSEKMINYILFKGVYREASVEYGSSTEIDYSCSVEYNNEFYIFGGINIKNQVKE